MEQLRVGIDVGGTFTHAVAIDATSHEVKHAVRVPTTHHDPAGVAAGVVHALLRLVKEGHIDPQSISFIAHSTTQATNALLEGDLACVGLLSLGTGLEGKRTEQESQFHRFMITRDKPLAMVHHHLDTTNDFAEETIRSAILTLKEKGANVIVPCEAFSVDRPRREASVVTIANELGIPATATHHISSLYGLRMRARTAALNAAILPKMLETAGETNRAVKEANIQAPLMIMRSDGGVMPIQEMRERPIQTLLSGPAAGVAAALRYAKVPDGIFIEVGGTSTDLSLIRDGQSIIRSAEIGGHRLHLRTLDIQTVGVAGGSMIRMERGNLAVGPRSAHIAGLPYTTFLPDPDQLKKPTYISPKQGDPATYLAIERQDGSLAAITPTCAANALGLIPTGDPAYGFPQTAKRAFALLSALCNQPAEALASKVLEIAAAKIAFTIQQWLKEAKLKKAQLLAIGGGGAASVLVPTVARQLKMSHDIVSHASVISAIGCALALLHETIEKNITQPTPEDLLALRQTLRDRLIAQGATPASINLQISIDRTQNRVRAEGTGALSLTAKGGTAQLSLADKVTLLEKITIPKTHTPWTCLGETASYEIYMTKWENHHWLPFLRKSKQTIVLMEKGGGIQLVRHDAQVFASSQEKLLGDLSSLAQSYSAYGDAGQTLPHLFLITQEKLINLSGLTDLSQLTAMVEAEISMLEKTPAPFYILIHYS